MLGIGTIMLGLGTSGVRVAVMVTVSSETTLEPSVGPLGSGVRVDIMA